MRLIHYPNPILLRQSISIPETKGNKTLKNRSDLAHKMWEIMNDRNGVGLAAPQIGLNIRMFVWSQNNGTRSGAIWNPTFTWISEHTLCSIEGCLSLPNIGVMKSRSISSCMTGTDINCEPVGFNGDESMTRIWQHETDHLDGKLIIDSMTHDEQVLNRGALRALLKKSVI